MVNTITAGAIIGLLAIGKLNPGVMVDTGVPFQVEATAYCNPYGNKTYLGKPTIEGLTIAGCEEWLGSTCYIWNEDMTELFGIYEFTDMGGDYRIQGGSCIDIFFEDYQEAIQFGRQNVTIQIVSGAG